MSRVTYILGAGASFGERKRNNEGKITEFTRGLPVVNELERAIELLLNGGHSGTFFPAEEAKKYGLPLKLYNEVHQKLSLLKQACAAYPTIDTLAKQLYVTNRPFFASSKEVLTYDDLKRYLSTALLMMQDEKKRDLRYDGFIASLIGRDRQLPPMTILSWNYDVQFEMAYSGYYTIERYIPSLWKELNVFNKMYPTDFNVSNPFAMMKLNGTALFTDSNLDKWEVKEKKVNRITDCFYGGENLTPYQYGLGYLNGGNFEGLLSYAWEEDNMILLHKNIEMRTYDTRELVVVGYSFPYVNNEMDSFIIQNMSKLDRVVIQDRNFEDIKERIEGILEPTGRIVEIVNKKNLSQFYIPNRFE